MPEETQTPQVTAVQDLIAGGIAGSISVIVGHPFDTYKVRLQTASSSTGETSLKGGVASLFRGMVAPLSTAAVINALIFSSFGESSRLWDDYIFPNCGEHADGHVMKQKDLPLHEHGKGLHAANDSDKIDHSSFQKSIVCGSFAGFVQSLVICPSEHIKCRLQIQYGPNYNDRIFKGPFDATDKILNSHGIRGLFRGFTCTLWREVPAFACYFTCYDYIKDAVTNTLSSKLGAGADANPEEGPNTVGGNSAHAWAASCVAGGISGASTWALIYPFDVIKTRIQTAPLKTPLEERRIAFMFRHIVRQHGVRFLFRGLGVTVFRAFPVNAIIFPVYEFTLMQLTENGIGGPRATKDASLTTAS